MGELAKEKVDGIREVFLYLKRFQNRTFVIKIDNPLLDSSLFPGIVRDIAQLRQVGIRILIVVGARERIDDVLDRYDISYTMAGSTRISSPEAMPFVKMAAFDAANRIMTLLTGNGLNAVIGNWVRARTLGVIEGVDYMNTGEVEKIRTDQIDKLLDDGTVPIFPCIGWSSLGEPYNLSSNRLARVLAGDIEADKLFFVTHGSTGLPSRLTVSEAEDAVVKQETLTDELREILTLSVETCRDGVNRVHIIDGTQDGAMLQEVFSNLGAGSMVYANQYEKIREMQQMDIPDVLRIMIHWIQSGHLVERTEESMKSSFRDYFVYEIDGTVHASGSLMQIDEEHAEIGGIAVDPQYIELGIGRKLAEYLIEKAVQRGFSELFLLTTQAFDWFKQLGFSQVSVDDLPESRRATYDSTRNSRIMRLIL